MITITDYILNNPSSLFFVLPVSIVAAFFLVVTRWPRPRPVQVRYQSASTAWLVHIIVYAGCLTYISFSFSYAPHICGTSLTVPTSRSFPPGEDPSQSRYDSHRIGLWGVYCRKSLGPEWTTRLGIGAAFRHGRMYAFVPGRGL